MRIPENANVIVPVNKYDRFFHLARHVLVQPIRQGAEDAAGLQAATSLLTPGQPPPRQSTGSQGGLSQVAK